MDMVGRVEGGGRQGRLLRRTESDSKLLIVEVEKNRKSHQSSTSTNWDRKRLKMRYSC